MDVFVFLEILMNAKMMTEVDDEVEVVESRLCE